MYHVINHGISKNGLNWKLNGQVIPSKIELHKLFHDPACFG